MISFLILPMQRVTRLPLLTDVSRTRRPLPGREREAPRSSLQGLRPLRCRSWAPGAGGGVRGTCAGARVLRARRQACVPCTRADGDTAGACQAPRGSTWVVLGGLSVWTYGMSDPPRSLWGLPQTGPRLLQTGRAGVLGRCPFQGPIRQPDLAGAVWGLCTPGPWQEPVEHRTPPGSAVRGLGGCAPRRPEAWSAGGYVVPDAGSALQTLCLKSQGHPERYKAASRALKAISKVRGVQGERRGHRDQAEVCPFPPSVGDPEGRVGFHTVHLGLFSGLMGKPRPRGRRALTWSGSPSWGRQ